MKMKAMEIEYAGGTFGCKVSLDNGRSLADATKASRLIEAAPEVLEACKNAQAVMDAAAQQLCSGGWIEPKEQEALAMQLAAYAQETRSAIAKAEGKEHSQ